MVTILEALAQYNQQHGTAYATVAALGADLAKAALREAWMIKRREEGHVLGVTEAGVL